MLLPTLSLYVADVGGNAQQVGFVIGGFTLGLVLFRPRLAQLADQRGRKLVLLIGIGAVTLAPLGYAWVSSLPLLFGLRIFHGVSVAAFTLASSALVADLAPPLQRTTVISYMSLATPVGMTLGPAVGSLSLDAWGYGPMFYLSALLGMVSFGLGLGVSEAVDWDATQIPPQGVRVSLEPKRLPFWSLLRSPAVHIPALMLLLVGLAFGTLMAFLPLYVKTEGIALKPGLFFSTAAVTSFCMRLLAGAIARDWGAGLLMSLGLGSYGFAMGMLYHARSPEVFLLAAAIEGGGFGLLLPMVSVMMADRARPQERGRMFGLCLLGLDLGGAIAAPLFGLVAQHHGYRILFAIACGCTSLAFLLFATRSSKDIPHSLRFALGQGRDVYALPK